MEPTQVLDFGNFHDKVSLAIKTCKERNIVVGVLEFKDGKQFDVLQGDTILIGRDTQRCQIVLENNTVSRVHAVLEIDPVDGEVHLYDNDSTNHTWKNNKMLKSMVRYHLEGKETITFGNISVQFTSRPDLVPKTNITDVKDTKSNTGASCRNGAVIFSPKISETYQPHCEELHTGVHQGKYENKYDNFGTCTTKLLEEETQKLSSSYGLKKDDPAVNGLKVLTDKTKSIPCGKLQLLLEETQNINASNIHTLQQETQSLSVPSLKKDDLFDLDTQIVAVPNLRLLEDDTQKIDFSNKSQNGEIQALGNDMLANAVQKENLRSKDKTSLTLPSNLPDMNTILMAETMPLESRSDNHMMEQQTQDTLIFENEISLTEVAKTVRELELEVEDNKIKNDKKEKRGAPSGKSMDFDKAEESDNSSCGSENLLADIDNDVHCTQEGVKGNVMEDLANTSEENAKHRDYAEINENATQMLDFGCASDSEEETTELKPDLTEMQNVVTPTKLYTIKVEPNPLMTDSSLHFCVPSIKKEPTTGTVCSDSSDDEFLDILPSTQDLVKGLTELETSNETVAENQYWETDLENKDSGRRPQVLKYRSDMSLGEEVSCTASLTSSKSGNISINGSNCKLPNNKSISTDLSQKIKKCTSKPDEKILPVESKQEIKSIHTKIMTLSKARKITSSVQNNVKSTKSNKKSKKIISKKMLNLYSLSQPPNYEIVKNIDDILTRKKRRSGLAGIKEPSRKDISTSNSKTPPFSCKRKRQENALDNVESSPLRKRIKHKIMFTGYEDQEHQSWMEKLNAEVVSNTADLPSVLVTDKIRGTAKFFCALARGVPIVSRAWVRECNDAGIILDPMGFIINDKDTEKKFGFSLLNSLKKASEFPLLLNYKVHATKSCMPPPSKIKEIVESAGGSWLKQIPKLAADNIIIISCVEDKTVLSRARESGFNVQNKEFLLTGLFKQKLDFHSYVFL